jgi:hypothetical protein
MKDRILIVDGCTSYQSEAVKAILEEDRKMQQEMDELISSPDQQCLPEDLPKVNLNGKRMAVQPLDRRQNYLTTRNSRW